MSAGPIAPTLAVPPTHDGSVPPISRQYIARSAMTPVAAVTVVLKSLPASSGMALA